MLHMADPRAIVIARARSLIGTATYYRYAELNQAPKVVNCLTLVSWAYQPTGLVLPGTLDLIKLGEQVTLTDLVGGELIFTAGWKVHLHHPEFGGIGHVGIATGEGTVIHATRRVRQGRSGVYEDPLATFLEGGFRVARRLLAIPSSLSLPRVS